MAGRPSRLLLMLALLAGALLGACGGEEESSGGTQASARTEATEPSPSAQREALEHTDTRPVIPKPTGSPPRRLVKEDVVRGKGPAAQPGDKVAVRYVGVAFSTGEEFDASWDGGGPFVFRLGAGRVIAGWDRGIVGMRRGGRRLLTIPPEQAYGAEGFPPDIAPNETLVFVVDLVALD